MLAPNGSIDVIATVIEAGSAAGGTGGTTGTASTGGQPVHNGTVVTFTTTIGTITPNEARTKNGQVTVKLTGDGRSGIASIFAYSGSAKSAELKVNVGAAAVERLVLTASPQSLPPSGGTAQLAARVEDISGNPLPGIDVTFSTTTGTVLTPTAKTDDNGVATTSLITTLAAKVTASSGAKSATIDIALAPRTGISITAPSTAPSAGSPASFTVSVASAANVRDVKVEWGDGSSSSLGAVSGSGSITHVYDDPGTFTVTATATDAAGNHESVSTSVTVLPQTPVGVTLTASSTNPVVGQTVTFTATNATLPAGVVILGYNWNFGDGSTFSGTSNISTHIYSSTGPKDISVTLRLSNGGTAIGVTSIIVSNPPPVTVALSAVPNTATHGVTIVKFTATVGTLPPGVSIVRYDWSFGNTVTDSTSNPTHDYVYPSAGLFTATVTVVLSNGTTGVGQAIVNVN